MIMSSSNALQPASGCAWRSERDTRRPGVTRHARGQSIVELAMILPVVLFLLLGAVDYAQVLSAEQHLENAAHVATLRLLTRPSLGSPANLKPLIQAESGLSPLSQIRRTHV